MPRTKLSRSYPSSNITTPEAGVVPTMDVPPEVEVEEFRMRVPGTIFEVDQDGYVRVPGELLKILLDNAARG